jgi:predicted DNA-binding transcriptional regulator AlpA
MVLTDKLALELCKAWVERSRKVLKELRAIKGTELVVSKIEERQRYIKRHAAKLVTGSIKTDITGLVSKQIQERIILDVTTMDLDSMLVLAKGMVSQLEELKARTRTQTHTDISFTQTEVLSEEEAAKFLKISTETLRRYRRAGIGPEYRKVSRRIVYSKAKIIEWLEKTEKNVL